MRLLLLGANGQVGWELQRALAPVAHVVALGRKQADFTNPAQLTTIVRDVAPDIIVNAAAYTAVDRAQSEPEIANLINAESVATLAEAAARRSGWLIHYSTDYVFDGSDKRPRLETDPTNPLNVYGQTKRDGELAIIASSCSHIVLRTSWVYSARGANFIKTMLRLASDRTELSVVTDQWGAPTGAELIADVTAHVVREIQGQNGKCLSGTYHLVARGETNWCDYTRFILNYAAGAGVTLSCSPDSVVPVPTAAYPTSALRPLNSRLDTRKLREAFGIVLPDWREGVSRALTEMIARGR